MKKSIILVFFISSVINCKKDQIRPFPKLECEELSELNEVKLNVLGIWELEDSWTKDNTESKLVSKSYKFVDSVNLIITNEFESNNPIDSNWKYSIHQYTNEPELLKITIEGLTPGLGGTLKICENSLAIENDNQWEIFLKN